jgi:hypothetical protein
MANVEIAIINVAIPSVRADLGASEGELAFVVSRPDPLRRPCSRPRASSIVR